MATTPGGLGRLPSPYDPRDARYPLRALLAPDVKLPTRKTWKPGPRLDQGQHPSCTGFCGKNFLNGLPVHCRNVDPPTPEGLYAEAQAQDGWPLPHDGSSVRALLKALQDRGKIASYHWAADVDDAARWLLTSGSIMWGLNWYSSYFEPDAEGIVRIGASSIAGGHAFLGIGYDARRDLYQCFNSWGRWSKDGRGRFWVPGDDMRRLLSEDGEAAAALEAP